MITAMYDRFVLGGKRIPKPVRLNVPKFKAVEVGRGSAWGNKPTERMAGDAIPEGLDALISEIRDEGKEELRQEAMVQMRNPEVSAEGLINRSSRTAEQQIARDLIMKGQMPDVLPADTYAVRDLAERGLGIAGPFQLDSTVRQSTTGGLNDKGLLEVERKPVRTEYLSGPTEERLFREWSQLNPGEGRDKFNAAVGEYYGQQALKATGNTPVIDEDRSSIVLRGQRNDYPKGERPQYGLPLDPEDSTAGTDRLIENSVGILNPEIDRSGDYRYVDENGNLTVGDYQMGDVVGTGFNENDTIRWNVLKDLSEKDARTFQRKFARGVEILREQGKNPSPYNVVNLMVQDGILPGPKRQAFGPGIRGGKGLSASELFREANYQDQYRYDKYLYGHGDKANRNKPRGYMPEELIYVDNLKANKALGERPGSVMVHGEPYRKYGRGADIVASVQDLVDLGAAKRLHEDPRVRQLLQ